MATLQEVQDRIIQTAGLQGAFNDSRFVGQLAEHTVSTSWDLAVLLEYDQVTPDDVAALRKTFALALRAAGVTPYSEYADSPGRPNMQEDSVRAALGMVIDSFDKGEGLRGNLGHPLRTYAEQYAPRQA